MNVVCHRAGPGWFDADRSGAAAVEFALTAPILFLLLFAALEFGSYNMIEQTANNAAFEAARRCVLPGVSALDGQNAGLSVLNAVGITGGTVTIDPDTITDTTTHVTAIVTVPLGGNLWTAPVFLGNGSLTRSCTLTCDWVDSARWGGWGH